MAGAAMVHEDVAMVRVEAPTHVGTVQGFLWSSLPPGFRVLPQRPPPPPQSLCGENSVLEECDWLRVTEFV